jgi:hypothetical protein
MGFLMNRFHDLARRMNPPHASWQAAAADLTLEQVNYQERAGVLPIAFSLMHLVMTEDQRLVDRLGDGQSLWTKGNYAE